MLLENGLEVCTCRKKNCVRHGNCTACLEYHQGTKRPVYCKRGGKRRKRDSEKPQEKM